MPAMILRRRQESLMNCSTDEQRHEPVVVAEHVRERVRLLLKPEAVALFDSGSATVHSGLARARNPFFPWRVDRTHAVAETTSEEVVPRGEAVVGRVGIAEVRLDEVRDSLAGAGSEPPVMSCGEDVTRLWRGKELGPDVKHVLEVGVYVSPRKHGEPGWGAHGPVEDGLYREADEVVALVLGGRLQDIVEEAKHYLVIPNLGGYQLDAMYRINWGDHAYLRLGSRIVTVWRLPGDLLEHLVEAHVDYGVILDELLESLQYGSQRILHTPQRTFLDLRDALGEPLLHHTMIFREPAANALWDEDVVRNPLTFTPGMNGYAMGLRSSIVSMMEAKYVRKAPAIHRIGSSMPLGRRLSTVTNFSGSSFLIPRLRWAPWGGRTSA